MPTIAQFLFAPRQMLLFGPTLCAALPLRMGLGARPMCARQARLEEAKAAVASACSLVLFLSAGPAMQMSSLEEAVHELRGDVRSHVPSAAARRRRLKTARTSS
jgi:hypothetical protein